MSDGSDSGLPNAPALMRYWQTGFTFPNVDNTGWLKIADADPSRWLIDFADINNRGFQVCPVVDNLFLNGWRIAPLSSRSFKMKDYLEIVGADWYGFGLAGPYSIQVYTASIRLTPRAD